MSDKLVPSTQRLVVFSDNPDDGLVAEIIFAAQQRGEEAVVHPDAADEALKFGPWWCEGERRLLNAGFANFNRFARISGVGLPNKHSAAEFIPARRRVQEPRQGPWRGFGEVLDISRVSRGSKVSRIVQALFRAERALEAWAILDAEGQKRSVN